MGHDAPGVSSKQMPLASQIELPERYRVVRHIASGGMASVWEAEDLLLGRLVAVKLLAAHFAADEGARERFQREARTAAQVSDQPHVVTIYDVGEHRDQAFIVMEHFGGGTVADRIRAARKAGEKLPRKTVLRWLREAAAGLDVAHAAGIVHRDVKPANLLLDVRERLAVGDFGIARLADDTQMTQTGQVLGTAAYLSPEQALGRPATAASDRYALAVVAYELLVGSRPFSGGPPTAQARQHVEAPPPRASQAAPDLRPAIDGVLVRGLAKEPSERPGAAAELVGEIERALDADAPAVVEPTRPIAAVAPTQPTVKAPPRRAEPTRRPIAPAPSKPPPARRATDRRLTPLVLLAVAALSIGAIAALAASGGDDGSSGARTSASSERAGGDAQASPDKTTTPRPTTAQPASPRAPAAAGGEDPAALDRKGYALIRQEQYADAVALERAAVQGFRDRGDRSSPGYAFALYNLGTALNRSGNPREAIGYLQERLRISNDRPGLVRNELRSAQQKLGGADSPAKQPKTKKERD